MGDVSEKAPDNEENSYIIRPHFQQKFRPLAVKEKIHTALSTCLSGKSYKADESNVWCKTIAEDLNDQMKELGYERYKFVTQVVIGEQRGEGVKMGCTCFWDSDTDNYAQDIFMNESIFAVAAVFGIFHY